MRQYLCLNVYVCIKILISYLGFSQLRLCKPPPPVSHSGSLEKTHILPGTCGSERELRYRLVTAASVTVNVEHLTHQIHLSFLQLDLLLPQLLAVKQFHTEVLTHNRRIRKRYLINLTFFIWGNSCCFHSFRTILPPGKLSCCLDESAEPSETNVWHFQMNFYPPFHSWLPESKELKKRLS